MQSGGGGGLMTLGKSVVEGEIMVSGDPKFIELNCSDCFPQAKRAVSCAQL